MDRQKRFRFLFYAVGIMILALGLILNTKAGLGVSPIMSLPYCISEIWGWNFGDTTLVIYCIFVGLQFLLKGKRARLYDLLQIPFSVVFTRVLNFYNGIIQIPLEQFWQKILLLLAALLLTGVGAAMVLNMRLVPNPCDGIVQAVGEAWGKETGLAKNLFDLFSVAMSFLLGMAAGNWMCGIGVGTLVGVVCVGRVISLFNCLFQDKVQRMAGIEGQIGGLCEGRVPEGA